MSQEFNCPHPAKYGGDACAACLTQAYELLDQAKQIFGELRLGGGPQPVERIVQWNAQYEVFCRGNKRIGILCVDGWSGRTEDRVEIIGETPKRYRIRADRRIKLAGRDRWLEVGDDVLVPKTAVRIEAKKESPTG